MLERVRAPAPATEVQEQPVVWEPAAWVETRVPGAGLVAAVGRTPVARVWTVARAQVGAPDWLGRDREVKPAKAVERAKAVKRAVGKRAVGKRAVGKRVQAVHRVSTALCRCHFGSIGSMSKVERRR
jgi:hypothetical protein